MGGGLDVYGGTATLDNTIVALNTAGTGSTASASDIAGTVSSASAYNLIGTGGSGGLVNGVNGNQVGVANPGLGTLADNGGPTQTIALLPGSPAIDKGSNALAVDPTTGLPLATDQRGPGFVRIINGTVNIGAYEFTPDAADALSVTWGTQTAALQTAADGLRLLPAGRKTDSALAGHRPVADHPQPGRDADRRRRHDQQRHRRQLRAGDRLRLGDELHDHPGPADQRGRPGHDHHRQPGDLGTSTAGSTSCRATSTTTGWSTARIWPGSATSGWESAGAKPTIFGDINGDGKVNVDDYNAERLLIGTSLPSVSDSSIASSPTSQAGPAVVRIGTSSPSPRTSVPRARPRAEIRLSGRGSIRGTLLTRGRPINQSLIEPPTSKAAIG